MLEKKIMHTTYFYKENVMLTNVFRILFKDLKLKKLEYSIISIFDTFNTCILKKTFHSNS